MDKILNMGIDFIISFVVVFLIYVLFLNRKRKTYKTGKKDGEITVFIEKYKLDMTKTRYKSVLWTLTFINTFIISFTATVVFNIEKFIWQLVFGFVILGILIYSLYEIAGRVYKRKEGKKNV